MSHKQTTARSTKLDGNHITILARLRAVPATAEEVGRYLWSFDRSEVDRLLDALRQRGLASTDSASRWWCTAAGLAALHRHRFMWWTDFR